MRPEARLIIILLILVSFSATALAHDFIALTDGGWKDPATWGFAGYACDLNIPGIVDGRLDTVLIPSGITVYYEGDYYTVGARGIKSGSKPKSVTIAFSVPSAGERAVVTVYDVNGRRVRRVFEGPIGPAGGTCVWDGTDAAGRRVSSGVYVYRIETDGLTATGKVVLAK